LVEIRADPVRRVRDDIEGGETRAGVARYHWGAFDVNRRGLPLQPARHSQALRNPCLLALPESARLESEGSS
jgi:hypothetical protein